MHIHSFLNTNIPQQKNNVPFKGSPLFDLPIQVRRQGAYLFNQNAKPKFDEVTCQFSLVTNQDYNILKEAKSFWDRTTLGGSVIERFLLIRQLAMNPKAVAPHYRYYAEQFNFKQRRFFMLEEPGGLTPEFRIKGLVEISERGDNDMHIHNIQSGTENPEAPVMRGVGTALIYGICRLAQIENKDRITLHSAVKAKSWYRKLGFTEGENSLFTLEKKDVPAFLERLQERMGIKRPEIIEIR